MSPKEPKDKRTEEEIKEIVVARLNTISPSKRISIGSKGDFGKDELIKQVKEDSDIGKKIVEMELAFLRAQKEGLIMQ